MQLPPLDVYLTWPIPNYAHPSEVRGPAILVLTFIFVPLLVLLVALRTYTRLRLIKNFGYDDIAIVAAVFPTLACAAITVYAVMHIGWDRHIWDVPIDQIKLSLKLAMAIEITFSVACTLTRISILLLVLRLMAAGRGILTRLAKCIIALICIEEIIFTIVVINTCGPVSEYWTLSFKPQNCINEASHLLAAGIINTFNDFCVVLIPIPVVLKLNLPLRQRMFCAMLFGAGFIVCIAGAARIAFLYQLNTTYDKTWLSYPTWICGTLELYLGIMATTIPAIKPLVTRYFPNILGHTFTRRGTVDANMRSLEPYLEQNDQPQMLDSTSDFIRIPSPVSSTSEKESVHVKSRPLILTPVVSTFSTYGKDDPDPLVAVWKGSPLAEGKTAEDNAGSLEAAWTPTQARLRSGLQKLKI